MGTQDLAPDGAELGAGNSLLGLVDVSNLLAEVELGSLGVIDTIDLEQGGVVVGVATTSVIRLKASY